MVYSVTGRRARCRWSVRSTHVPSIRWLTASFSITARVKALQSMFSLRAGNEPFLRASF